MKEYENWRDLYNWLEMACYTMDTDCKFHVKLVKIGNKRPSYCITADGYSHFPISRRMAKKLIKEGTEVENGW